MITIPLPVTPYLKKYLTATYGNNYTISLTDEFGVLILNCLNKQSYYNHKLIKDQRTSIYTLKMSVSQFEKHGCSISERQLLSIFKNLDSNFRTSIYKAAIINKARFNVDYQETILVHLESYDITDDDMDWDRIIKGFYRKKPSLIKQMHLQT